MEQLQVLYQFVLRIYEGDGKIQFDEFGTIAANWAVCHTTKLDVNTLNLKKIWENSFEWGFMQLIHHFIEEGLLAKLVGVPCLW